MVPGWRQVRSQRPATATAQDTSIHRSFRDTDANAVPQGVQLTGRFISGWQFFVLTWQGIWAIWVHQPVSLVSAFAAFFCCRDPGRWCLLEPNSFWPTSRSAAVCSAESLGAKIAGMSGTDITDAVTSMSKICKIKNGNFFCSLKIHKFDSDWVKSITSPIWMI